MNTKILFSALALLVTSVLGYWLAPPFLAVALLITLVFSISYIVSSLTMLVFVSGIDSQQQFRLSWAVATLSLAMIFTVQGMAIFLPMRTDSPIDMSFMGIPIGILFWIIGLRLASRILDTKALYAFSRLLTTVIVSAVISRLAMHYVGELQMYVALGG